MNKEKALATLTKLKSLGFEEYWTPSRHASHFLNKKTMISLTFHWPTYSFKANNTKRTVIWSDKHQRCVYLMV